MSITIGKNAKALKVRINIKKESIVMQFCLIVMQENELGVKQRPC